MKLMEKFAAYVEKNKIPLSPNQQHTIIEANTVIPRHILERDIDAIYFAVYSNYVGIFLLTPAPKTVNTGSRITIRLFGKNRDYQKYVSQWIDAARRSPSKQWYYVPKSGKCRKMEAASAEWAIHNIHSQGRMIYLEL